MGWKEWKKGFEAWENNAASYAESVLRSPILLNPIGNALTAAFQGKAGMDQKLAQVWASLGLPTREDQERLLHAVNQLESRLIDVEERLLDLAAAQTAKNGQGGVRAAIESATAAAPRPAATVPLETYTDAELVEADAAPAQRPAKAARAKKVPPARPRPSRAPAKKKAPAAKLVAADQKPAAPAAPSEPTLFATAPDGAALVKPARKRAAKKKAAASEGEGA